MIGRMWKQICEEPPEPIETGHQILERSLHDDFEVAVQAAIGLLYDGSLTQAQADYIIFRASCQPAGNYYTAEVLAKSGITASPEEIATS